MKRVIPLILLGIGLVINLPVFSAPIGAYNQIMQTVYNRDEAGLKYLVSMGVNVNAVNMQGKTALCSAIENLDYQGYELLLSQGASAYTPCIREIKPDVLRHFADNQPPLGTYYQGASLAASRGGVLSESAKNAAKTISSLPYPHWGEILLAGVAVGTAFAVGVHGSSGGSSGGKSYEAPLDLDPNTFIDTEYKGGTWKDSEGVTINNIDFLSKINAANAYARGYTGYEVSRDANGNLVPLEDGTYITDTKVKVAVMDNGQYYNTDLYNPNQTTTSVKGLNYVYGVYDKDYNNSSYWSYADGKATLTLNGETTTKTLSMTETEWDQYAGKFAPVCTEKSGLCLKLSSSATDDNGYLQVEYVNRVYTPATEEEEASITDEAKAYYYIYPEMWGIYNEKYKTAGYQYEADNAFGAYFETESSPGSETSHGTHVAGIVAALRSGTGVGMQGVAYNAEVIPLKLDMETSEGLNHISDAVGTGARIVNLSFGPKENEGSYNQANYTSNISGKNKEYFSGLKTYYEDAKNGTALIFSAGNGYVNEEGIREALPQSSIFSAAPLVDSAYKNLVISVVALDNNNTITDYSNRCGATASYCLSAPGGGNGYSIVSTGLSSETESYYTAMMGTSQAAPVVSGSLAVIMGAFPFLTTQEAVQILLETAKYIPVTDQDVINEYNASALAFDGSQDAYAKNTVEGKYNAIYGRGLVDLEAATSPVGLPKIPLGTTTASVATASSSYLSVNSTLSAGLQGLPQKMIILDDYNRAYAVLSRNFVRSEKRSDGLRRSFRSFVAQNEKEIKTSEELSFAFSASSLNNKFADSMSVMMRPNKNIQMRFGFTADTASFGGSYAGRSVQNPFLNMREAFGFDSQLKFASDWVLTGAAYVGKNGFIDEDIFDKISHQPRMQLVESGVAYQGIKDLTFGISGGIMKEEESLFGMRGAGAFDTNGAQTRFVRLMANYQPTNKFALTGTYTYGMTDAARTNSLISFSRLTSDSFALAAEYMPDEKQTFGVRFVSPLRVRSGSVSFDLPVARDMYEDKVYRENYSAGLKPDAREYNVSLFYAKDISSVLSWAGEGGVRLNPDHQKSASPDYRALFKLNWNW